MARDAGAAKFYPIAQETKEDSYLVGVGFLERFAALVAAAEREDCIRTIELYQVPVGNSAAGEMAAEWTMDALREVRDAIRARQ